MYIYKMVQYFLLHVSAVDRHFQGTISTYSFKKYAAISNNWNINHEHTTVGHSTSYE